MESSVQRYLEEVGSATATSVEGWLSARTLLVEGARQIIETSSSAEGIQQAISRPVMRDNFGMTYLGRADSAEFFNSPPKPMPASYDYRTRPRYQQAKAAGSLILSEPYLDTATQKLVVSMATPVLNEQKLLGVLGVDLELDSLVGIIAKQELGGRGEAFLVNSAGK
ncbi:cache domain-containing protein [Pseudomonas corrugata]